MNMKISSQPLLSYFIIISDEEIVPTDAAGVLEAHREEKVVHLPPGQRASGRLTLQFKQASSGT